MNSELGGMTCVPLEWLALFALAKSTARKRTEAVSFHVGGCQEQYTCPDRLFVYSIAFFFGIVKKI